MRFRSWLASALLIALVVPTILTARASGATTLYFHALAPVSKAEEAGVTAGEPTAPTMDENAPILPAPKVGVTTAFANTSFRENPLMTYWQSGMSTQIINPTVHFWATAAPTDILTVQLYPGGPAGPAGPVATASVDALPGTVEYTVDLGPLNAPFPNGFVVSIYDDLASAQILFDSIVTPSSISFTSGPPVVVPSLDDPAGLAFRGTQLLEADSGSGKINVLDPSTFAIGSPIASGLVQGGFARGVSGLAVDGDGKTYASVADAGTVLAIAPDGTAGVYARDLGTPIGLAFDGSGNLYVADRAGRRIVKVNATGAQSVLSSGFAQGPYGVAVSPDGSALTVSTQKDGKVYSVDLGTGTRTTLATLGTADSAEGLAYDTSGNLYVGDGQAGKVFKITPALVKSTLATVVAGPINLAFRPGTDQLLAATQSDDKIRAITASAPGVALAAPTGFAAPSASPARAWLHRPLSLTTPGKAGVGAARPVDPATVSATLAQSGARYTGVNAVEPTLGIQTDGDMFMPESRDPCKVTGAVICGRTEVYRTKDEALHWNQVTPDTDTGLELPPASADPYVYVDQKTNRVFSIDLTAACTFLWYSDTDGDTWKPNPLGCGAPPVDHQTFVASTPRTVTTNGYPNVLSLCSNWLEASTCQRSLDGGDTWQLTSVPMTPATPCGGGITSHLATDSTGRLFLPKVSSSAACLAISENDGSSWTVKSIAPIGGGDHEGRIAADKNDNLYYVWIASDRLPYLVTSIDHGATWSAPKMIAPPGVTATNLPAIAAGANGKIVVSYMGTTVDYGYATNDFSKASWNAYLTVTTDALGSDPLLQTTTGNALTDPIKRQDCGPGRCGLIFDFLDVRIAPDGRAWATFGDMCYSTCVSDRTVDTGFTYAKGFLAPLATGPNLNGAGDLTPLSGGWTAGFFGGADTYGAGAGVGNAAAMVRQVDPEQVFESIFD